MGGGAACGALGVGEVWGSGKGRVVRWCEAVVGRRPQAVKGEKAEQGVGCVGMRWGPSERERAREGMGGETG